MEMYQFLTLILLIMKCTGVIGIGWFWVFSPCIVLYGLAAIGALFMN